MKSDNDLNRLTKNMSVPKLVTNEYLLLILKKGFASMYLFGLLTAVGFMVAIIEAKSNEFENFILFCIISLFFSAVCFAIHYKLTKVWLPEIKFRLERVK